MKNEFRKEIEVIVRQLIEVGLVVDSNFPVVDGNWVRWSNFKPISGILKNIPYKEKYDLINNERNFTFKFLDSAIVQLAYEFDSRNNELVGHRLAFYPAPNFKRYLDSITEYEEVYYGNSEFHDLTNEHVISSPFRFDYSQKDPANSPIIHSASHCHMGEFQDCRIPVSCPITPVDFMNFILNNFYKCLTNIYQINISFVPGIKINPCMSAEEKRVIHFSIN